MTCSREGTCKIGCHSASPLRENRIHCERLKTKMMPEKRPFGMELNLYHWLTLLISKGLRDHQVIGWQGLSLGRAVARGDLSSFWHFHSVSNTGCDLQNHRWYTPTHNSVK